MKLYLADNLLPIFVSPEVTLQTPLHCACAFGHPEIVRLLLESSETKANIKDSTNLNALSLAITKNNR